MVTVLSAQTTDKRVNAVRPRCSRSTPTRPRWPPRRARLEELIQPTGFFRAKTESLLKLSQASSSGTTGRFPGAWRTW